MKILVTGAQGFIGTNLIKKLSDNGHNVIGCDLKHSQEINQLRCDISEYREISKLIEENNFDLVYNLAAEYGRMNGEHYYEKLWNTNVVGLKHIIRLQENFKFKLISISSAEVYGDYRDKMSEDIMNKYAIPQLNDYAISKWAGELIIRNSMNVLGTESVIVRPFNVYGPGEEYSIYRGAIPIFTYKSLNNEAFTVFSNHYRSFIYIDEAVEVLCAIADNFIPGEVYNLDSGDYRSMVEVAELIIKECNGNEELVTFKKVEENNTLVKKSDISKLKRDFGIVPKIKLEQGISSFVKYFIEKYKK